MNALRVVMCRPWPVMMPDRIGIIGNTHGVNARPRPIRKKAPITTQVPWPAIIAAIWSCSDCFTGAVAAGGAAVATGCAVAAAAAPLAAGRLSLNTCFCGG